jgi:DNA-binding transcriptional ArsR family regulator
MRTEEVFKALADPNRRKILKLLKQGSLAAGEIAKAFPITKGSLSHHFNVLKAADLIRPERRGQSIVYSLNTTVFEDVAALFMDLFQAEGQKGGTDEAPQEEPARDSADGRRVRGRGGDGPPNA